MGNWTTYGAAALSALALLAGTGAPALAGPGSLTISGTATIGSTTEPFVAVATFHWADDLLPPDIPAASYNADAIFTLGTGGSATTYTGSPDDQIVVVLQHPAPNVFGVELQDDNLIGGLLGTVSEFFTTETLDPATDTLQLSGQLTPTPDPYGSFALAGAGNPTLTFDSLDPSASIGVPEPGALGLVVFSIAAVGYLRSGQRAGAGGPRVFRPCWCYKVPQWRRTHTQRRTSTEQHEAR